MTTEIKGHQTVNKMVDSIEELRIYEYIIQHFLARLSKPVAYTEVDIVVQANSQAKAIYRYHDQQIGWLSLQHFRNPFG